MSMRVLRRCGYFVAESRCERSLGDWGSDGRLYVRAWWKQEQSRISDLCRVDASQERSALPNDSIICWAASEDSCVTALLIPAATGASRPLSMVTLRLMIPLS